MPVSISQFVSGIELEDNKNMELKSKKYFSKINPKKLVMEKILTDWKEGRKWIKIIDESFLDNNWIENWTWRDISNIPKYGKSAFLYGMNKKSFKIMNFFYSRSKKERSPYARLQWKKVLSLSKGLYLTIITYRSKGNGYLLISGTGAMLKSKNKLIKTAGFVNVSKERRFLPYFGFVKAGAVEVKNYKFYKISDKPVKDLKYMWIAWEANEKSDK